MITRRAAKSVESPLYVYIDIASEAVLVGTLLLEDEGEQGFWAQFQYAQSYVDDPRAFSLDPLNLPLIDAQRAYQTESRYHVLGALFDAAPDAWGRSVMRIDRDGAVVAEDEVLLKGRGMGVGALFFSAAPLTPNMRKTYRVPDDSQIDTLAALLADIDAGIKPKGLYRDLLGSSWDIGGARPKTIVRDAAGEFWIAKFPRARDSYDRQRVEFANLQMARAIGMTVPDIRLIETSLGAVLMTHRFDRHQLQQPAQEGSQAPVARRHFLSGAALVSPSPQLSKRDMDTPRGVATYSYARLADIIKRISANPVADLKELYARMVLNVAVHNTDDHLKNIGFLKVEGERYRLSPLFDVVTQEGTLKHYLHIGKDGRTSTFENALSDYSRFGIRSKSVAQEIVDRVKNVVGKRADYYDDAHMTASEVQIVEASLSAWHSTAH